VPDAPPAAEAPAPKKAAEFPVVILASLREYKLTFIDAGTMGWLTKTYPDAAPRVVVLQLDHDLRGWLAGFAHKRIEASDENKAAVEAAIAGGSSSYERGIAAAALLPQILHQDYWSTATDLSPLAYEAQIHLLANPDIRVFAGSRARLAEFLNLTFDARK
jgi:hypothetical protein